jgi:hypothetical protein
MTLEKIPCLTALYLLLSLPCEVRGPVLCREGDEESFADTSPVLICPTAFFIVGHFFSCSKFDEQAHHGRRIFSFPAILGSKQIREVLVLRDFTVGTRIVRPFTEACEEFGPRLGGVINNVGWHGDL